MSVLLRPFSLLRGRAPSSLSAFSRHPCSLTICTLSPSVHLRHPRSIFIRAPSWSAHCRHPCTIVVCAPLSSMLCLHSCSVVVCAPSLSAHCRHPPKLRPRSSILRAPQKTLTNYLPHRANPVTPAGDRTRNGTDEKSFTHKELQLWPFSGI